MPFKIPGGVSPLAWLRRLMNNSVESAEGVYHLPLPNLGKTVKVDNVSGAGATPNHQNINYRGATLLMTPEQFRGLALPRPDPEVNPYVRSAAFGDEGISGPQFYLTDRHDQYSKLQAPIAIGSHEGRNRMGLIEESDPELPVPVQIFPPYDLKARDLSSDWLRSLMDNIGEERAGFGRRLPERNAAVLNGQFVEFAEGGSVDYDPKEMVRQLLSSQKDYPQAPSAEPPSVWQLLREAQSPYRASIGAAMTPEGTPMPNAGTFNVELPVSDRGAVTLQGMAQAIMEEQAKGIAGGGRLGYRHSLSPLESVQPYIEGGGSYVRTPHGSFGGARVTGGGVTYNRRF